MTQEWRVSEKPLTPTELLARVEKALKSMGAKYTEYKAREAKHRQNVASTRETKVAIQETRLAERENGKAHGVGMSITLLKAHMVTKANVDIPLPDSQAGDLPEV